MEPKEKAKELIERFVEHVKSNDSKSDGNKRTGRWGAHVIKENAKACAVICVDTILKDAGSRFIQKDHLYWQSVRQEILNF